MQAAYTDSAANVKRMSFLSLACRAFNVYNNCMVRLIFTAGPPASSAGATQSFPVPSFPQMPHCCFIFGQTIQEDTAMIAR
uniref:hypothetical protein n=1 Tax=Candidatus Electronema sp. TaxID=2698783 RepID=UPI004056FA8C